MRRGASLGIAGGLAAKLATIPGQPPDLSRLIVGCAFAPRCPYRMPICTRELPPMRRAGERHFAACFYRGSLAEGAAVKVDPVPRNLAQGDSL